MKLARGIALLLMAPAAHAANENIPIDRAITELVVYDKAAVIRIAPGFVNNQNCPSGSSQLLQLAFDSETGVNTGLLSTLLAAASAGKTVGFGIGGCAGRYPSVYRVDVKY